MPGQAAREGGSLCRLHFLRYDAGTPTRKANAGL
jgi:hypothetical protein